MTDQAKPDPLRGGFHAAIERERNATQTERDGPPPELSLHEQNMWKRLSPFYDWGNYIFCYAGDPVEAMARMLGRMREAHFLPPKLQIKANMGDTNALRLSNYHNRATADPALKQGFWFHKGVIYSGDIDEYEEYKSGLAA